MRTPDHPAQRVARALLAHPGSFVVAAHVDPDGDALGSVLTLARALRRLGRAVVAPMSDPPRFLRFLARPGELVDPLQARPADALVVVLDGDLGRAAGVPLDGGRGVVNVDHHASNAAEADVAWVDPTYASASMMVAEVVDALGVAWDEQLATPCLAGLMTDTGHFRFGNTDRRALEAAGRLIEAGVAYADLADRLQWRHPDYFRMLALVMATVRFHLAGEIVLADQTNAMRDAVGDTADDADDFVGQIRYAEGTRLAAILKERPGAVKLSLRSRGGVSARRICQDLGGGGHDAAAGATLPGATLAEAEARLLEAARRELLRAGPAPEAGPAPGAGPAPEAGPAPGAAPAPEAGPAPEATPGAEPAPERP
jgi:bifunctional oligoribonuclease and PAP phosphatase NrnA